MPLNLPQDGQSIKEYDIEQTNKINGIGSVQSINGGKLITLGDQSALFVINVNMIGIGAFVTKSVSLVAGYKYIASYLNVLNGGAFGTYYPFISVPISHLQGNSVVASVYKTDGAPNFTTGAVIGGQLTIILEKI